MNYTIDVNSGVPAYIQLYQFFRDDIVQGVYPYKTKLPSKRVTCSETNLSIITVEHAYDLLIQEGYIESKERSGYFVIFKPNIGFASYSTTEHLHKSNLAAINGLDDLSFPFSSLAKSMRKVLSDLDENILERSDNLGCYELRKNISLYLARSRGIHAVPEQIVIGAGSEYLYGLITTLLGRHKKIAIETPSYKQIEHVYSSLEIDYEKLWADIYALYLKNPVGFRLTPEERRTLNGINQDFRYRNNEETILLDCLDWDEPEESWTEKTASQIATEIREKTGLVICESRIGKTLKSGFEYVKKGYPRGYRVLNGRSLYLTPKVIKEIEIGCPFDEDLKGKTIDRF